MVVSKKVATGHAAELTIDTDDVGPVDILPHDSNPEVLKTLPVKVGLLIGAFAFRALCVKLEMGLPSSVVLSTFPRPTAALDIPATIPVKVGLASGAFASRAACVRPEMGLPASVVLSTFPRSTAALDTPITVPVKVGLATGAFASRTACVRLEMGLPASVVLSTFPRPTAALDTATTLPVMIGLSSGAFFAKLLATVLANEESSFSAVASSFSVFNFAGAESINFVNLASTSTVEYVSNLV